MLTEEQMTAAVELACLKMRLLPPIWHEEITARLKALSIRELSTVTEFTTQVGMDGQEQREYLTRWISRRKQLERRTWLMTMGLMALVIWEILGSTPATYKIRAGISLIGPVAIGFIWLLTSLGS